ncbi:MAG: hypothetical protein KTR31_26265 [Myxococcales bacterium]|nr:hypothetical protein [Myxococcales bacterium]
MSAAPTVLFTETPLGADTATGSQPRPPSQVPTLLDIDPAVKAAAAAAREAGADSQDGIQTDVMPGPTALEAEAAPVPVSEPPGPPPVPEALVTAEPTPDPAPHASRPEANGSATEPPASRPSPSEEAVTPSEPAESIDLMAPPETSPPEVSAPAPDDPLAAPKAPVVRPPVGATPAPAPQRSVHSAITGRAPQGVRRPSEQGWQTTLQILVGESTAVGPTSAGTGKGILLERAASIATHQLEDHARSVELYTDIVATGHTSEELLRNQITSLGRLGRYAEQLSLIVDLSEQLTGPRKADALLDAGLVAWRRLDQPALAVQHLRAAAAEDDRHYTARALLRALLATQGASATERMTLLDQLADLSEGGIAADAYMEAASVAEEAGDGAGSRARLEHALQAEPGHLGAFLRLERVLANDPPALARLYEREASRANQTESGWWHAEAARAHQRAGQSEDAVRGFNAAVSEGYPFALRELQGTYVQTGAWFELEDALTREAEALTAEEGQAFTLYRLGWLRESRIENLDAALEAYERAVKADPTSAPAADAVARLLRHKQDQQRAFLEERLEQTTLPTERRFLTLQLAEDSEQDGALDAAKDRYRSVLEGDSTDTAAEVARGGLERTLKRLQDRAGLAELRRQQATMASTASERALWLHEAASILSSPMPKWPPDDEQERSSAVTALMSALDAEPDHPAALGSLTLLLGASDRWSELADILEAAAKATTDEHRRAAFLYRAGRLYAERVGDDDKARVCLGRALAVSPEFRPARWLLRTVSGPGDAAGDASIYREEARHAEGRSERAWSLFAAAEAAGPGPAARQDLQRILSESSDHAGAMAALEVHCVADGDEESLTHIYLRALEGTPTTSKARVAARAAVLLERAGKGARALEVLRRIAKMPVEDRPLRACARTALRLGDQPLAVELLRATSVPGDQVEAVRLQAAAVPPSESLPQLMGLLEHSPQALGVAARAATLAQQLGDSEAMLRAYATIARHAKSAPLSAAYGSWTGMQLQASGKHEEALEFWRIAAAGRPHSEAPRDGVVRGLVGKQDAEGIGAVEGLPPTRRAIALGQAGHPGRGAEVLVAAGEAQATAAQHLSNALLLELLYEADEQWQEAYATLVRRQGLCHDPQVLAEADQRKRWILAEHLADTDAAWDLYRQLHEESPDDREVTEALARIAGARGDVEMAIGYLRALADSASSTEEAARYQRRVGEVHQRAGKLDDARQAYLDALGHLPTDVEALEGLKRLAESQGDWTALVSVMEREVGVSQGQRKVELRRQIAEVHETRVKDPSQTMQAWRALVELAPTDRPGLEKLLALSEAEQAWDVFVDAGAALAEVSSGAERGALLRRVGMACEDHLGRDDAAKFYQQAVAVTPPDAIAAKRLEGLARARADWGAAVGALALQARADVGTSARVEALLAAARLEVEARHDRSAAADFYRQILDVDDNHEPSLRFMASHLFETGAHPEALAISRRLEPFVEANQDLEDFDTRMELSSFYFFFAEMLRAQGDHGSALKRYSRALELNPTHLPSLQAIGPLYTEAQEWRKAEEVYRALLQLSGGHGDRQQAATTYTQLGLVERELGNTDKAYKRFNKALELHPNHVGALKGMALVLNDRKDWSNLLNVYNNIIYHAVVPEDVIDAYMTKGRILDVHMQRQDKAAQHYQRSLDFDPHQPLAFLRLAELALRRKTYRDAGELAEKALQLDEDLVRPHRALLLLVRALAWQDAGRKSEAQRCLREAGVLDRTLAEELGANPLADPSQIEGVLKRRMP